MTDIGEASAPHDELFQGCDIYDEVVQTEDQIQDTLPETRVARTRKPKTHPWERDLFLTTVHELGHAAVIEALGMECRRIAVEVNPNHKPGDAYWIGHTSNRQANQETPDEAILINIAGVVAEGLYGIPRITAFQAALLLDKNRHIQECNGAWSDAHVKKALRLLRGVWPSLLAEAGTWSAEQLINHPAPNSITVLGEQA